MTPGRRSTVAREMTSSHVPVLGGSSCVNMTVHKTFTSTPVVGGKKNKLLLFSARPSLNLRLTYTNTQKDRPVWWCSVGGIHSSGDL